ncbi:neuronal acetylcholine receptor subunit beta-2-like isoform X2 [Amphiura filiformis]|uniref:neuronal acetylcholine receptor subunit beta-2-like isoform X2 n=1 Tax=Amphiura filiformis TaxID=82378 RepID=UPI003B2137F6
MPTKPLTWILMATAFFYLGYAGEYIDQPSDVEHIGSIEGKLITTLLENNSYNKRQRPINSTTGGAVEVVVAISIQALQGVNERIQMLTIATWLSLEWRDYRLSWEPSEYGGIERISLPTKDIWSPRIVLENTYESAESRSANRKLQVPSNDDFSRVVVSAHGVILYDTPEVMSSLCSIDVADFPFDVQNCSLDFTNQADTTDLVVLRVGNLSHTYEYDRAQWKLLNVVPTESTLVDPYLLSGNMSFSYVHFQVYLKRLPYYHLTTSALPSTVLTVLGFTAFWLPPECGEKISLGVSLLLGLTVFQLVVSEELPEKSAGKPPLLGMYLSMNFAIVAASLLCTAVSLRVYLQPGPIRNRCVRAIFLHLLPGVLFCSTTTTSRIAGKRTNACCYRRNRK